MPTNHPIIQDVAELAGVSKSTVSAVLNGNGSVGQARPKRALAAVEQVNYHPQGSRHAAEGRHQRRIR